MSSPSLLMSRNSEGVTRSLALSFDLNAALSHCYVRRILILFCKHPRPVMHIPRHVKSLSCTLLPCLELLSFLLSSLQLYSQWMQSHSIAFTLM